MTVIVTLTVAFLCVLATSQRFLTRAQRSAFKHWVGGVVYGVVRHLGGAWVKLGQLASYRQDLLGHEISQRLSGLTSNPVSSQYDPRGTVEKCLGKEIARKFRFESGPINSGSVADVFVAQHDELGAVAVKLVRPEEVYRFRADATYMRIAARLCGALPSKLLAAQASVLREIHVLCVRQLDLGQEAKYMNECRAALERETAVRIPLVHLRLSSKDVLTMEYVDHLNSFLSDHQSDERRRAITVALRVLYRMIFRTRLVHCDLHPGNLWLDDKCRVVFLDFGLMYQLSVEQSEKFRGFFWGIAANRSEAVIAALLSECSGGRSDACGEEFRRDITALVSEHHGVTVAQFQITRFVARLCFILRKHRLIIDQDFFMPVMALLVFEGVLKNVNRDMRFQSVAMPFFFDLALKDVFEWNPPHGLVRSPTAKPESTTEN